jgi:hypothetical protein
MLLLAENTPEPEFCKYSELLPNVRVHEEDIVKIFVFLKYPPVPPDVKLILPPVLVKEPELLIKLFVPCSVKAVLAAVTVPELVNEQLLLNVTVALELNFKIALLVNVAN